MSNRLTSFNKLLAAAVAVILAFSAAEAGAASRIKDIAHIDGLKKEMVIGYGLVVGLAGTGDGRKATFTMQSLQSMLERFGVTIDAEEIKVANVAAVMVTGEIDPFMRVGSSIDVTVNSLGDASSLEGGTLLATPLIGVDGNLYALAQGSVSIGGFNVSGGAGNTIRQNHTTVGKVVGGGVVQQALELAYIRDGVFDLTVRDLDFYTVRSMTNTINATYGDGVAEGIDGRTVRVAIPTERRKAPTDFIAELQRLPVEVDVAARVVINEKTGTVVIGTGVEVGEAAIAHGNLKVEITTRYDVSQGAPFGDGSTTFSPGGISAKVSGEREYFPSEGTW